MSATEPTIFADLTARLEETIAAQNIPGASIAAYYKGKTYEAAAGFANVPAKIAADTDTIFQIGSVTKTFNVVLLMKLHEQGVIDIDAPASRYLPDLKVENKPVPDALTVRSLLDYTAGMEGDFFGDFGPSPNALEKYVNATKDLRWIHEPGKMRNYNSTSHCIAGRIAEVVTEEFYNDALTKFVLAPLGLERFAFYTHDIARYRTAVGHRVNPASGEFEIPDQLRMAHNLSPAGSSVTMAARDLLKFAIFFLDQGVSENGARLLKKKSIREIIDPSKTLPPNDSEIMMGWASFPSEKGRLIAANGETIENNAFVAFLPGEEFAIAALANTTGGGTNIFLSLGREIMKACVGVSIDPPTAGAIEIAENGFVFDAESAAPYIGEYFNGPTFVVDLDGDSLKLTTRQESAPPQTFFLGKVDKHKFALAVDKKQPPLGAMQFVFQAENAPQASHIFWANRLFIRTESN